MAQYRAAPGDWRTTGQRDTEMPSSSGDWGTTGQRDVEILSSSGDWRTAGQRDVKMSSSSTTKTPSPLLPPCRVCRKKATGFHYGVNTCEACKVSPTFIFIEHLYQ